MLGEEGRQGNAGNTARWEDRWRGASMVGRSPAPHTKTKVVYGWRNLLEMIIMRIGNDNNSHSDGFYMLVLEMLPREEKQ